MITKFKIILSLFLVGVVETCSLYAQEVVSNNRQTQDTTAVISYLSENEWELFGQEDLLELSLKFDMRKFMKYTSTPEYQDAIMLIHGAGTTVEKKVQIKPRGSFRLEYCTFPPLKLGVKKTDSINKDLYKKENFKVVTQCKNANLFESYLLKEYLIYKLYNQITDLSLKVRLVKMRYIDTPEKKKPKKTFEKFGFIIEPISSLAKRSNMVEIENLNLGQKSMDKESMARVALFEFMIGNTDWTVANLHNLKLLKANDFNKPYPYPVPYDFDYSGMVNTIYAIPLETLGISSVTERLYRGVCIPEEWVYRARNIFLDKKVSLFKVIDDFKYLDKRDKAEMTRYLDGFYRIIESDRSFKNYIIKSCL